MTDSNGNINETEEQLILTAQTAVSSCNWVVGECAAKWTKKYAKGRTDADFATEIGLTPDQVFQRRRVWETFGDVYTEYASLKWSHFYVGLNWDDAPECLQWAEDNDATVAEMRAWRRAVQEDLTEEAVDQQYSEWGGDPHVVHVPFENTLVKDPADMPTPSGEGNRLRTAGQPAETVGGSCTRVSRRRRIRSLQTGWYHGSRKRAGRGDRSSSSRTSRAIGQKADGRTGAV